MIANELFGTSLYNDASLVSYWRMEGNSNDSKGSNNGTDTAITYGTANGKFGQGALFNGSSSKIALSTTPYANFTYNAWVYNNNHTAVHTIKSGVFNATGAVQFRIETDGKLGLIKSGVASVAYSTGTIPDGVWTMATITYDASGNYIFYINGVASGSGTNLQTFANVNSIIGASKDSGGIDSEFFNGSIDDVSVFSRALTPSDIQQLYYAGAEKFYTPYKGSIGRYFAGDPTMKGYWQLDGESSGVNDANLVSYWKLDGNSNDSKGTNNGTDTAISYGAGVFGQSAGFNGSTSKISTPVPNISGGAFSICGWFKISNTTVANVIYGQGNSGNNNPIISLATLVTSGIEIVNRDNSAVGLTKTVTTPNWIADTWYHVAWTCSTTSSNLYLNGIIIDTTTFTANTGTFNTSNIGVRQRVAYDGYYNGSIDEVSIYNKALSATEITAIISGGLQKLPGSIDNSGNGNNGTDTNVTYVPGKFGKAASFNGASSKILLPNSSIQTGANTRSLLWWLKKSTSSIDVLGGSSDGTTAGTFGIYINNTTVYQWGGTDDSTGFNIDLNRDVFIATTYDGTNVKTYVNGMLVKITSKTLNTVGVNSALGINAASSANYFNGTIYESANIFRELSPQEISSYYLWATSGSTKRNWLTVIQRAVSNFFLFFD